MPTSPRAPRAPLALIPWLAGRPVKSQVAGLFALAALGACQLDRSTGVDPSLAKGPSVTSGSGDTSRTTFTVQVSTKEQSFTVGDHKIKFGAGIASICDPLTSGYGPTEWDKPCAAARTAVIITAKSWRDALGHPQVEFMPALRFGPTGKESKVYLYLKDKAASFNLSTAVIAYCTDLKNKTTCVNEAKADPALATYLESSGYLVRRIKHFSGYNVAAREELEPAY